MTKSKKQKLNAIKEEYKIEPWDKYELDMSVYHMFFYGQKPFDINPDDYKQVYRLYDSDKDFKALFDQKTIEYNKIINQSERVAKEIYNNSLKDII